VIIIGREFNYVTDVRFGSTSADVWTVYSASEIWAGSPPGTGTVDITVVNSAGTSAITPADRFTYYSSSPAVTGVSPNEGPAVGGNTVTITGTGLSGATAVKFGSNASVITSNTATQIVVTAPDGDPGVLDITVTTPDGTSAIVPADRYRYRPTPVIYFIAPISGPTAGGTIVTITGIYLDAGTATVRFGTNVSASTVDSDSQITAVSPAGSAGALNVRVTNNGGTSAAQVFTYV
jgi:hypothetical protein